MLFFVFCNQILKEGGSIMAKKNLLHKNKNSLFSLFVLLVLFLMLSLLIPAIGVAASSPLLWINIVDFFIGVKLHFAQYWMFYSFAAIVIFAYFNKK